MVSKKLQKKKVRRPPVIQTPTDENQPLPAKRMSDDPAPKREKWTNKQRVLVFAARGINHRDRHLMRDIKTLMPHHRTESKMERSKSLSLVNEMCEMKHCNKSVLFEGRRKRDLYMWLSNVPNGPSVKFLVENIHTMGELKMTGNCLRGSRPLLSFDQKFDEIQYLSLLKELFTQIFGVPNQHPKSQPFVDHVYTFTFLDNRIWFRNFQILSEDGGLAEVGPRFVMNPVKIFEGSFTGKAIWENPTYISPSKHRQSLKKMASDKYVNRIEQKVRRVQDPNVISYKNEDYDELLVAKDVLEAKKMLDEQEKREEREKKAKKVAKVQQLKQKIKEKQMNQVQKVIEKRKAKGKKPKKADK